MASDPRDQNAMTRRAFATRVGGVAAAAFVAGNDFFTPAGRERRAVGVWPRARRQRQGRARQHRHPRSGQRAQARLRAPSQRRDQDAVRHRRATSPTSASTTPKLKDVADVQARASCRTCAASSTTRTSTASSSPRRTSGTRWPPSGRCRPASTSTSRSRRPTRCGKGGRWSTPPAATTRSCRSAR